MATGRGWIYQQHAKRSQKPEPIAQTRPPSLSSKTPAVKVQHKSATIPVTTTVNKVPLLRKPMENKQLLMKTYIERLPCEILLKIFSFLDPLSLMVVGSVNRRFYKLSKDNVLWHKIYISRQKVNQRWKSDSVKMLEKKLSDSVLDPDPGYWKKTYIKELMMTREKKMIQIMKSVKSFCSSEIPVSMKKAVRESSVTVTWNSYLWPEFHSLTKIRLHGITPVLTDNSLKPIKKGLRRLSLIAEYDLRNKKDFGRFIGQDMHIKLFHLHPGLIVGLWKKSPEIAFVMGTLHYHQLLEKSFLGSTESPYIFPPHIPILDDIDPEYGLHGYQLHIDMYSGSRTFLCRTFRGLFCRKEYIKNGHLRIAAIGLRNHKRHASLAGKVDFLWETLTLSGSIQNCFTMDVTVLDESEAPYWCFSAPVQLCESKSLETCYDFMGQNFDLNYKDDMGRIHAELIWMKEAEEYYVINLVLYLNTEKVNSYFGTNYTDSPVD
ncbi:F-box only protein 15 isoform X2 [Engystomops pustulosus]|uniref:F-box only protein 15 isoform X2 n=1 Tax=Engystomops pustulosus TaxID=76066 RepID=UPI003AFA9BC3